MKRQVLTLIGILLASGLALAQERGTTSSAVADGSFSATSGPYSFDIRRSRPRLPQRTDYALLIANSEYDDPRYRALPNCVLDVDALGNLLRDKYGFTIKPDDILRRATYTDFEAKLKEYAGRTWQENDQLLIYVAGHGELNDLSKEGLLVMKDAKKSEPATNRFSLTSLQRILKNMPCKHVLLVLDVCYGGTIDDITAGMEGEPMRGDALPSESGARSGSLQPEYVLTKLKPRTRLYVASGGKEPVGEGRAGEHSPFAKALLETLNKPGTMLTVYDLATAIERKVPTVRVGPLGSNQPNSDFLFIAK